MNIHHLNCATLCPRAGRLVNERRSMVCHCLLVEASDGLVLVDTGFGSGDVADPAHLGKPFNWLTRPRLDPAETALAQVRALGLSASDVRHIVVTHLDLDHAGGLPDFPDAAVHVYRAELDAMRAGATRGERARYRPAHFAHGPRWTPHTTDGETWMGFDCVRSVTGTDDEILLVPLLGHTRGHCAVAVRAADRWLLHCGDAYFYHGEVDPAGRRCPPGLRLFQSLVEIDRGARLANQQRLRELAAGRGDQVALFCAHDPVELDRLRGAAA